MTSAPEVRAASLIPTSRSGFLARRRLDEALTLEHVSGRAWRVCDSRLAAGCSARILACIEESDGSFVVMQVAETFVWTSFDSMRGALDHIVATSDRVVTWQQLYEGHGIVMTSEPEEFPALRSLSAASTLTNG